MILSDKKEECYFCRIELPMDSMEDNYEKLFYVCNDCYALRLYAWENMKLLWKDLDKEKNNG